VKGRKMADYVYPELLNKYEFRNYGHALEILSEVFPKEWKEIQECLAKFVITEDDLLVAGGNESQIPKKFDDILYPYGWKEIKISGDLEVKLYQRLNKKSKSFATTPFDSKMIKGYIDGHNIDFVKGKVAFDLEWNSKDQTFDRDLLAMRTYFECGIIDVGIIVTRSTELVDIFKKLDINKKYGPSTTHMDKLIYRLDSRRNGGCPILAIGIRKAVVEEK
jgi:CRISPR-associated protein Csd2